MSNIKFVILGATATQSSNWNRNTSNSDVISAIKSTYLPNLSSEIGANDLPVIYIEERNQIYLRDKLYGFSEYDRLVDASAGAQVAIDEIKKWSVNGKSFATATPEGAVVIDASDISIGITAAGASGLASILEGGTSIDNALIKLYTYIKTVSDNTGSVEAVNRLATAINEMTTAIAGISAEALKHSQVTGSAGIVVSGATGASGMIYTVGADNTLATKEYADNAAITAATGVYTQLIGASGSGSTALTIYGAREYAESLVNALSSTLTGVSAAHWEWIEKIKAELEDPNSEMTSFLDKLRTVSEGFKGIDGATASYEGTIKQYIDEIASGLSGAIETVTNTATSAVQSVNGVTGIDVVIGAQGITMTAYDNGITGGVTASDTVSVAISKVENQANAGITAAAIANGIGTSALSIANGASAAAASAQASANEALGLLEWIIV